MAQGLVIPVDVQAFCVSPADQKGAASFLCATADFSAMPYFPDNTYSTQNVVNQGPCTSDEVLKRTTTQWDPGVHLHWALPDALASGEQDNDTAETHFPTAPNRWLVTRLVTRSGSVVQGLCQSWVVESDQLSHTYPHPQKTWPPAVTVPVQPSDYMAPDDDTAPKNPPVPAGLQAFQYLGNFYLYGQWVEGKGAAYLYQQPKFAPYKLTAICYGNPSFSGFYPDCASVFGFFDSAANLAGLEAGDSLAYHVVGWYWTSAVGAGDDPLHGATLKPAPCTVPTADNIAKNEPPAQNYNDFLANGPQQTSGAWQYIEALKWLFSDPAGNPVQFSLYSGLVKNINWDPKQSYIQARTAKSQVAIGNTGAEAIAALTKGLLESQGTHIDNIEEILNALQLGILPDYLEPGGKTRYAEALHQSHFGSYQGGILWQVSKAGSDDQSEVTLPPAQATLLNDLNALQMQTNSLQQQIIALGRQIFADWYKYQVFWRTTDADLETWANEDPVGAVVQSLHGNPNAPMDLIRAELKNFNDKNTTLTNNQNSISSKVATLQGQITQWNSACQLISVPAPKYWHANEPVVLLSGDMIEPVLRYGGDGRLRKDEYLECRLTSEVIPSTAYTLGTNASLPHADEITALVAEAALHVSSSWPAQAQSGQKFPSEIGVTIWTKNPWLPLMLEWVVDYQPAVEIPHESTSASYSTDLVTAHYVWNSADTDLVPKDTLHTQTNYTYKNRVLLSAHPAATLKSAVSDYLTNYSALDSSITDSLTKVQSRIASLDVLAQGLGGFNRGLLMGHQVMQLGIADPMWSLSGVDVECQFWVDCAKVLSDAKALHDPKGHIDLPNDLAPDAENNFSPIRAGYMHWTGLRLVGVFGQIVDVNMAAPAVAASLTPPDSGLAAAGLASLAPRLAQPSRLLFDWISAASDKVEFNKLPAASPICGWILFNHLDNSLVFYDASGGGIGSLTLNQDQSAAIWQGVPGSPGWSSSIEDAFANQNQHLRDFALGIKQNGAGFLEALLLTIDKGLGTILPASGARDPSTAVLISRPLALVRASLSLDLQGDPARSQSWETFQTAGDNPDKRTTASFEKVQFPVQLGKVGNLEDGLLGYFISDTYSHFYSAAAAGNNANITAPSLGTIVVTGTGTAVEVSMLVDPRAVVHATSGVVPAKTVQIPPDQIASALRRMSVTFLTAPILTGSIPAALPVPGESGGQWSWLTLGPNAAWSTAAPTVANPSQTKSYSPQQIVDGWLKLSRSS